MTPNTIKVFNITGVIIYVLSSNIMIIFPSAEALKFFAIKLFRNGSLICHTRFDIKMSLVFSEDKAIVCGHFNSIFMVIFFRLRHVITKSCCCTEKHSAEKNNSKQIRNDMRVSE